MLFVKQASMLTGSTNETTIQPPEWVNSKLFIPLSIGNHYYSSGVLRDINKRFVNISRHSILFICDELRRLSYIIKGYSDDFCLSTKTELQTSELKQALFNCGLRQSELVDIWSWSDLPDINTLTLFNDRLMELIANDEHLCKEMIKKAEMFFAVAKIINYSRLQLQNQLKYFALETSLSIYMNEILCCDFEVYKTPLGVIDYIYAERSSFVYNLIGKKPRRATLDLQAILEKN